MFKKLLKILDLQIQILLKELEIKIKNSNDIDVEKQWHLETGKMFNDLVSRYAISEEELLSISETVCKFVTITRRTNIDKYLFEDDKLERPRLIK
jgi:hypothetical protein